MRDLSVLLSFLRASLTRPVRNVEFLPKDVSCAKETRDLIIECCVGEDLPHALLYVRLTAYYTEFIHLISSEANEICEHESKKTIAPEHIISALKVRLYARGCASLSVNMFLQRLGFDGFTEEIEDVLKDHKQAQKVCIPYVYCRATFHLRTLGSRKEGIQARSVGAD